MRRFREKTIISNSEYSKVLLACRETILKISLKLTDSLFTKITFYDIMTALVMLYMFVGSK